MAELFADLKEGYVHLDVDTGGSLYGTTTSRTARLFTEFLKDRGFSAWVNQANWPLTDIPIPQATVFIAKQHERGQVEPLVREFNAKRADD